MLGNIPVNRDQLRMVKDALAAAKLLQSPIDDRVDYILKTMYGHFGLEVDYWFFKNAENDVGFLPLAIVSHSPTNGINNDVMEVLVTLKSGNHTISFFENEIKRYWSADASSVKIPLRWLFEDFEHTITIEKTVREPLKIDKLMI